MIIQTLYQSIKSFIRSRRHKIGKNLFAEALMKQKGLLYHANDIKILALGSSHCACGFQAELIEGAYNLGNSNQDLYTSYQLVTHYADQLKKMKHLIVFYSVFSPGHELAKTSATKQVAINHYVFGIPYPVDYLKAWQRAAEHRFKTFDDNGVNYPSYYGFIPTTDPNLMPIVERCSKHLRENQRGTNQTRHLAAIADFCRQNHIRLSVIIPPYRSDYNHLIAQEDSKLFPDLFALCATPPYRDSIFVLNYRLSPDFDDLDFMDSDHLNQQGAEKLTRKIAQDIGLKLR